MDEGLLFLRFLGANTPPMEAGDRMRWKLKPNGVFDIRSYYNKLRDSPSTVFPWKAIWRVKAPRRVSFFVWCVAWNKILTKDNLRLEFVDWCIICRHCAETVDHLLLHCEMENRLWSFVFITVGAIQSIGPLSSVSLGLWPIRGCISVRGGQVRS